MSMRLKKLTLERCEWAVEKERIGQVFGIVIFDGELGEVHLKLTPDLCHKLFLICADGIIGVAKEAATNLICEAHATIAKDATASIVSKP